MNKLSSSDLVAIVLLIVGGLNWGLVGLFRFDLVATIFGGMPILARIVYVVVGASAVYVAMIVRRLGKSQ